MQPRVHESARDEGNRSASASTTNEDNSQVADDVVLLWHVVSRKVRLVAEQLRGASVPTMAARRQQQLDAQAILQVLRGLHDLVTRGLIGASLLGGDKKELLDLIGIAERILAD